MTLGNIHHKDLSLLKSLSSCVHFLSYRLGEMHQGQQACPADYALFKCFINTLVMGWYFEGKKIPIYWWKNWTLFIYFILIIWRQLWNQAYSYLPSRYSFDIIYSGSDNSQALFFNFILKCYYLHFSLVKKEALITFYLVWINRL